MKKQTGTVTLTVEQLHYLFLRHNNDEDRIDAVVQLATGDKGEAYQLTAHWRHECKQRQAQRIKDEEEFDAREDGCRERVDPQDQDG